MSYRPVAIGGMALLLFLTLFPGSPLAAAPQTPEQPAQSTPPAAAAAEAEPSCGDCHELAAPFTKTNPHARGKVHEGMVANAVCESCHGDGTAHIEGGGDTTQIVRPRGRAGAEICLKCHDVATDQKTRRGTMHTNTEAVNCLSCHWIHTTDPGSKSLLKAPELAVCSECHATQVASFRNKPYAHRLGRGGMSCASCHEPHGRPSRESLRRGNDGELPCYACHAEKAGPFVFPHGAVAVGDCMSCHEPHGSVNPMMIKRANVWQLCIECHSPIAGGTLGSQPPSFHNLTSPRYQNCTSCHVAVHGSNRSPVLFK